MSWFRRRPKPDPTTPVDPPEGMKWVVSRSLLALDGAPLLEIGLWAVDAHPNEWGVVEGVGEDGVVRLDQPWAAATAHFREDRPRHLRRASIAAMREFNARCESAVTFEELRERFS